MKVVDDPIMGKVSIPTMVPNDVNQFHDEKQFEDYRAAKDLDDCLAYDSVIQREPYQEIVEEYGYVMPFDQYYNQQGFGQAFEPEPEVAFKSNFM